MLKRWLKCDGGRLLILNNSVTFNGKPMLYEEFLNQRVEALVIIADRHSRGRPRKMES